MGDVRERGAVMGWIGSARRWMGAARARSASGALGRLRRDVAGNTLAMMAAAMVPLIGFTGSAVDMARLYVVKVRLQQACDAGALAGRHAMQDVSIAAGQATAPLDTPGGQQAQQFFANNFQSGWFQASTPVFVTDKRRKDSTDLTSTVANTVHGQATTSVPMALMSYFGVQPVSLSVSCQALYEAADNDIMFVLDTTGSMSCWPSDANTCVNGSSTQYTRTDGSTGYYQPEKGQTTDSNNNPMYSKLESLRRAVVLFDSTIRANTTDPSTHFRYGFVPYSSAVNVKSALTGSPAQMSTTPALTPLASTYIQNTSWTYQSRQNSGDYSYTGSYTLANGNSATGSSSFSVTGWTKAQCVAQRYPASGYAATGPGWKNSGFWMAMNLTNVSWSSSNSGTCSGTQSPLRPMWHYAPYTLDLSTYATGAAVDDPSRIDASTSTWRGCVEELNTTVATTFDGTSSNLPHDLNPDFIPNSPSEMWRPMWPDAEWMRNSTATADYKDEAVYENNTSKGLWQGMSFKTGGWPQTGGIELVSCEMQAQRLAVMTSQQVHDYVYANDFRAFGDTYHDVGMIWGTRMLSPNGVFGADTARWPNRDTPTRSIVFMTDGYMEPFQQTYSEYGVEALDQRVDGPGASQTTDTAIHTQRFRAECDAAKTRGITIYVVALGTSLNSDLTYCASNGQAFTANNTTDLTNAFATIAKRVAKLRISL